jgi:uncharacterized phage infection (PIP) family protein YhgE
MKSIVKNKMTMLIVAGVCILPSLYAWVNIKACWDPYGNTNTIPVAIVNEDKGTSFRGENLNIGNKIVVKLKNNHKIGWKFVNAKNAENDEQNIINLKDAIIKLSDNMNVITDVLGGISDDSNDFNSTLSQIKSGIPMINSRISTLENGNVRILKMEKK